MANGSESGRFLSGRNLVRGARVAGQAFMVASAFAGARLMSEEVGQQEAIGKSIGELPSYATPFVRDAILDDLQLANSFACGDAEGDGTGGLPRDTAEPQDAADLVIDVVDTLLFDPPSAVNLGELSQVATDLSFTVHGGYIPCADGPFAEQREIIQEQIDVLHSSDTEQLEAELHGLHDAYAESLEAERELAAVTVASGIGYLLFKERKPRSKQQEK
ncbi:MAG: hypothetical protein HY430_02255 [Candidatus Levybacteria bacterium]|nr:hypothetical protein [Candidatus Levybacteria bacterium]